jgi:hypothetical protein
MLTRLRSLFHRLTFAGKLCIFIPVAIALMILWLFMLGVSSMLFLAGDLVNPVLNKLDRWLIKDID